jgi:hypothetical protein
LKGRAEKTRAIRASFETMKPHLTEVAPDVAKEIAGLVEEVVANDGRGATAAAIDGLAARISRLRSDLPPGYFQPEKLLKSIEAARKARPDGIVIFAAGNLKIEKLWPALETAFRR